MCGPREETSPTMTPTPPGARGLHPKDANTRSKERRRRWKCQWDRQGTVSADLGRGCRACASTGGIHAPPVRQRFTLDTLAEARLRARTHIFRPDPCEACEVRTRLRL